MEPEDPIKKLEKLLEKDWDDGDRISVVINPPSPPSPPSLLPPQLDPKSPLARWVVTITLALAAVGGAVKLIKDLLSP